MKSEAVFRTSRGPASASYLSRIFKSAAKEAGVPWASLHTLRHTCATILYSRGANAAQVQHRLGHHSPSFSLNAYVGLAPDDHADPNLLAHLFESQGDETPTDATPSTETPMAAPAS